MYIKYSKKDGADYYIYDLNEDLTSEKYVYSYPNTEQYKNKIGVVFDTALETDHIKTFNVDILTEDELFLEMI